ncbi:hypothetical protein ACOSP6_10085 [Tenacibaculum sp. MEBiC06402]|uniref:hypothetical protein n=1 Tax=unclassified Tenacibaculum TaxID=2635139 RepID=UPI003B9ACCBA
MKVLIKSFKLLFHRYFIAIHRTLSEKNNKKPLFYLTIELNPPKIMNARLKILASFLMIFIGFQQITAQKVIAKKGSGIEYKDDQKDLDDMNSITAPSNAVTITAKSSKKSKKKVAKDKIESVKKVEKLMKQKKRLRFRNKRKKEITKCFKEAKKPCDADKKK